MTPGVRQANRVLRVEGVGKRYTGGPSSAEYEAVVDVSFDVREGEIVCVVGKTGCGKSTLVNLILGLDRPTSGEVTVNGVPPFDDFMALRHKIATVFQTDRLLPWMRVLDNAAFALEACGVAKAERNARAIEWLDKLGLAAWRDAYPYQLSGGMRQRIAIARAFAVDPVLLILDEAFGHLDEVTAEELRRDFLRLVRETNKASLVITHDIGEAIDIADRIVILARPATVLDIVDVASLRHEAGEAGDSGWREKTKARIFDAIGGDLPRAT